MKRGQNGEKNTSAKPKYPANVKHRQVTVERVETREVFTDEADVVISARGTLNDMAWPQIPGLSNLKIPVMHSAAWDKR